MITKNVSVRATSGTTGGSGFEGTPVDAERIAFAEKISPPRIFRKNQVPSE
jgi:hypothetical protein